MKKLGGYKLIDFGGVDISTSKTISGIYNEIEKTEKRIVGCNLKLGTTTFKELTLDVKKDGTNLVLSNSIIKVTITNTNGVVGELGLYNGYSDDNASTKKIYCHPITINYNTSSTKFVLTCIIFNNDETPFTLETFKNWIDDLYDKVGDTIRIMSSGGYLKDTNQVIVSYMYRASTYYGVKGMKSDFSDFDEISGTWETIFPDSTIFNDGVNAIN